MSQIYRYELFAQGMDFKDGFGFNICQTGVYQWFDVPPFTYYIDFLVSTEKFDESVLARPVRFSTTQWALSDLNGAEEFISFYQRTSDTLKEVSNKKIYIGVEY